MPIPFAYPFKSSMNANPMFNSPRTESPLFTSNQNPPLKTVVKYVIFPRWQSYQLLNLRPLAAYSHAVLAV
jgi:hypothetical protein